MGARTRELYELVQRYLLDANEELLGLHRGGPVSYGQYAEVANLLVDAQEKLKRLLYGSAPEEGVGEKEQTIPLPFWLFAEKGVSPLAKWTYGHLLKLRREFCRPGRNSLIIHLRLVSQDNFPTYAWAESHLRSTLAELTKAGMISSRKMEYPQDVPEQWESEFLDVR